MRWPIASACRMTTMARKVFRTCRLLGIILAPKTKVGLWSIWAQS